MAEQMRSGNGRHELTPHEMLEASARLGPRPRWKRFSRPATVDPPLYDESGFPIFEQRTGLTERVRRLLRG